MSEKKFIPLSVPNFAGREHEYTSKAVISEWVSSGGAKVGEFEQALAAYCSAKRAVATSSGTAGLHLALLCAGIQQDEEVIAPALTFVAAVNPIRYVGAQPVFLGCDDSLCISPQLLQEFCENQCECRPDGLYNIKTARRVAAVLVVHVFGNLADMQAIIDIAQRYKLAVIEDATEALGSSFTSGPLQGKMAGTLGDVGVYSFNGNKIITTGSGGALVSKHEAWAERAKHLSTQAKTDEVQFLHDEVGYNYRLSNIPAALGLAQLEQLEGFISRKCQLYIQYKEALQGQKGLWFVPFRNGTRANHWFFSLVLEDAFPLQRDELIAHMAREKIQLRPVWALMNELPPYKGNECHGLEKAQEYRKRIVNLPCSTNLSDEEQARVIETLRALCR